MGVFQLTRLLNNYFLPLCPLIVCFLIGGRSVLPLEAKFTMLITIKKEIHG